MTHRLEHGLNERARSEPGRHDAPRESMRGAPLPKIATSEHSGIPTGGADPRRSPLRGKWVFAGFLVLALLLLTTEHRAHLLGVLPWLLLLACPLMHLVMHGGHGHHHGHGSSASKDTTGDEN